MLIFVSCFSCLLYEVVGQGCERCSFSVVITLPVLNLFPQALTTSAHSVLHQGIPLQAGTAQFGCSDVFQQALIICPPAIQGIFICNCHSSKNMSVTACLLAIFELSIIST